MKRLLTHCLQNPATLLSVNKIYNDLRSRGYATSKNSLYDYMDYFEDAYCIFNVQPFDFSSRKAEHKQKKNYPVDHGLITAYAVDHRYQQGPALESAVFTLLKRSAIEVSYYMTAKGHEVDFLVKFSDQTMGLYQVSLSIKDPATRKREISALKQAMAEIGIKNPR